MIDLFKFILLAIVCSAVTTFGIWLFAPHQGFVIYRCDWSEISPDIPIEVKNECRKRVLHGTI